MLRFLAIGLAALVATACTYGSAVDIAPFKDRLKKPVVAAGDYCEMTVEKPYEVKSAEGCVKLDWVAEQRLFIMSDLEGKGGQNAGSEDADKMPAAIVSLGSNVYAAQVDVESESDIHQITLFVASGDAFATLPTLQDEKLVALARRHPKLEWADMPVDGEESGLFAKRPWIKDGRVSDIKAFLKEAAREGMRDYTDADEDEDVSIGVKDVNAAPNHAPSGKQIRDAENVMRTIKRLSPK